MLAQIWRTVLRILVVLGVLFAFFFVNELARAFLLFYRVQPVLGFAFAGVVGLGAVVLAVYGLVRLRRHPAVLRPPPLPPLGKAGHAEMRRYLKYLVRYLGRLADNPGLDEAQRAQAEEQIEEIRDVLKAHPLNDDLVRAIEQAEEKAVRPALAALDEQASKEIRRSVRDVMLAVMLSPYPSIDFLIVLYRNAAMVLRVVHIYRSRPAVREQLMVLRDILLVVATINFLNVSRKLIESLFSHLPLVGRAIDDIGQSLGVGLLTSVTGHAAIARCAAFRGWNREEEVSSLVSHMGAFLVDVRNLFTKDLFSEVKGRLSSFVPAEKAEEPGFWDAIVRGVGSAVDATVRTLDTLILRPAVVGAQSVAAAGSRIGRRVTGRPPEHRHHHRRHSSHHRSSRPRGVLRVLRTIGQRLKYTFAGRRLR